MTENDQELQKLFRQQNQKTGKYDALKQDLLEDFEKELSYQKQVSKRINQIT